MDVLCADVARSIAERTMQANEMTVGMYMLERSLDGAWNYECVAHFTRNMLEPENHIRFTQNLVERKDGNLPSVFYPKPTLLFRSMEALESWLVKALDYDLKTSRPVYVFYWQGRHDPPPNTIVASDDETLYRELAKWHYWQLESPDIGILEADFDAYERACKSVHLKQLLEAITTFVGTA